LTRGTEAANAGVLWEMSGSFVPSRFRGGAACSSETKRAVPERREETDNQWNGGEIGDRRWCNGVEEEADGKKKKVWSGRGRPGYMTSMSRYA
jgi:hypothetical protein